VQYRDIIIMAARTVDKGVVDVKENESWEWMKILADTLIQYMGKVKESLQGMQEESELENEGEVISIQVGWLVNPRTIRDRSQNGEIAERSVVFIVMGCKMAQSIVKKGIKVAGVWYRIEKYRNERPDSRGELCSRWGQIENMCGSMPRCDYCSGHHQTSEHKCNVVGCTAKHGSIWGHTLDMCPICRGNHIAFSSRCVKKREATKVGRQTRQIGLAAPASMSMARNMVMSSNRIVTGPRPQGVAEAEADEERMADMDEEKQVAVE
jgi:hypothetical protein